MLREVSINTLIMVSLCGYCYCCCCYVCISFWSRFLSLLYCINVCMFIHTHSWILLLSLLLFDSYTRAQMKCKERIEDDKAQSTWAKRQEVTLAVKQRKIKLPFIPPYFTFIYSHRRNKNTEKESCKKR